MPDTYLPFPVATTPRRRRRSRGPIRIEVGARSCWGYGPGLVPLLDEIGSPRMFCPFHKTWTFPVDYCADLVALIQYRDRRSLELVTVDR